MTRSIPSLSLQSEARSRVIAALRPAGCLAAVALLSACAGGGNGLTASQEASNYAHGARHNYSVPGSSSDPWGPYIKEASGKYDIPERWIREVMRVESGGRTEQNGRPITSGAGAMGLMQVMPATYDELKNRYDLGSDPYDPHNNILAGTAYIRELYDLYGSPGFLAAYNGGPGRLDDYLTRNRPLADETRRYVAKIGPYLTDTFPNKRSTAEMYAMNTMPSSIPAGPRYPSAPVAAEAPVAVAAYVPPPAPVRSQPAPAAPVEVAYAPEARGDAFDPPAGWTPPAASSRAEATGYVPAPMPARQSYAIAAAERPLPVPPAPAYVAPQRTVVAANVPEPPRFVPMPAPTVQSVSAYAAPRREPEFRLVSPAVAAPAPTYRGTAGQWAIQVGAFGNEGLAHMAAGSARDQAGAAAAGSRPLVAGVREAHGTLYRARLTGMSRDAATQACERIRNGRANCIVLSPDAQS